MPTDNGKQNITICALTTGRNDPSARFRVRQHIKPLSKYGITIQEYTPVIDKNAGIPSQLSPLMSLIPERQRYTLWRSIKLACQMPGVAASSLYHLVWLNRELLTGRYTFERFITRPIVLDIDDAVWLAEPDGNNAMRRLGSQSAAILAGNAYIAEWFAQYNNNIHVIPTAIDTERFKPRTPDNHSRPDRKFTVGWTGLSSNYGYILAIEKPLAIFLEQYDAKLLIISDRPPKLTLIPAHRIDYRPWSPNIEATAINDMDVGIMPLPDTPWTRGKCSFKMLQYMSAAIPVVASPVGMNADVFQYDTVGYPASSCDDWLDALISIYENEGLSATMGSNGRKVILDHFSLGAISEKIADIFHSLV